MAAVDVLRTPLCDTIGIELPIVQAPIGRVGSAALAAAVSNAGGLGMLGLSFDSDDEIRRTLRETRGLTDRPFGINLVLHRDQRGRLATALDAGRPRVVSFHWSALTSDSPYLRDAHAAGALVILAVGNADEARRARDAGVDIVVAQGLEAGGHVWGKVGSLALIPAVVDAVDPMPVIAAGGIGDGRGLAAVLALGAQAGWMGTRFVVADESGAHPDYRDRVVEATETDTVLSVGVFDRGFENAPVRTLDNSTLRRWREAGSPPIGKRPAEDEIVAHRTNGQPIARYDSMPAIADLTGDVEALANIAGQSAGVVRRREPAAAIVREVAEDAARILTSWREARERSRRR